MRIPPILAIFLLHPRNLEAQHAPGPRLLASTIQVLITIIQNKSIFLQGDWHRSKWIFLLHLQGGRFWKRGDLIFQVSSTSWKAGQLVPAKIPNVVSCARSCITLEQHNPCSCNAVTYTRLQRHTCCWYISWLIAFTRRSCLYCPVSNQTLIFWGSLESASEVWQTFRLATSQQRMCIFCKALAFQVSFSKIMLNQLALLSSQWQEVGPLGALGEFVHRAAQAPGLAVVDRWVLYDLIV